MEKHKIRGGFMEKYFPDLKSEYLEIEWPSTMNELQILSKANQIMVGNRPFKVDASQICQWAYRGFSLQHQGAVPMTEEDKTKAKEKRKADSSVVKAFSQMEKARQMEIITTLEKAGHDCSALRKIYSL